MGYLPVIENSLMSDKPSMGTKGYGQKGHRSICVFFFSFVLLCIKDVNLTSGWLGGGVDGASVNES